jgi:hypothetical protein
MEDSARAFCQVFVRDDFSQKTRALIAGKAGNRCSNPECRKPTTGSDAAQAGVIKLGVAAHITAAAAGGPRYDPNQTPEKRRGESNGIWLCQNCAKLIDSDLGYFTVELLFTWKEQAQERAFRDMVAPAPGAREEVLPGVLTAGDPLEAVIDRLRTAATTDLAGFRFTAAWPRHAVMLNLRIRGENAPVFTTERIPEALEVAPEICLVAPPGTGKTTTLIQLAEAFLQATRAVAILVPLGEWAVSDSALVAGLRARAAFRNVTDDDFHLLAETGRLVLLLDGWNELDGDAQRRLRSDLGRLRREMPLLRIVVSTRREALDVPANGPMVEIDGLSEDQQLEIARAMRGEDGARLVDQAWRTPGVRSLISIPLYLTALVERAPGTQMPSTKEEVLGSFIEEHERSGDHAGSLSRTLLGHHTDILAALAVAGIEAVTVALAEAGARSTVSQVETRLHESGQWRRPPEPAIALAALIDHHLLVRAGRDGAVAFQHQQFQEWYGALEVERAMAARAAGDANACDRLRHILNAPTWEESILFACERGSRAGEAQQAAVADAVLLALEIDPMLAAEMIYRSTDAVWGRVRERVVAFGRNWHQLGRIDRAARFMITSGRSEFAEDIWALISSNDTQMALPALRIARRFRPSVLGPDAGGHIAALPEEQRAWILSEIASRSGFDGMELATSVAKADPSPQVRVEVIEALQFRRGERHVAELLREAPDEVWRQLAAKGYAMEFADPTATARLRAERERQIANDPSPMRRLYSLLESDEAAETVGQLIADLIAAPDFPADDGDTGWTVHRAFERFPLSVAAGLLCRLAAGLEIPFRGEEMLVGVETVDDGPIAAVALDLTANRFVGQAAATVVGPRTVGALIDALADAAVEARQPSAPEAAAGRERYQQLLGRVTAARPCSLVGAVLARAHTEVPETIGLLADLLAGQDSFDAQKAPLLPEGDLRRALVAALHRWVDVLIASAESKRYQLAEMAGALGRVGARKSLPVVLRLLDEDLARRRRAKEDVRAAHARRAVVDISDAATSYVLQYRFAFIAIGGEAVATAMIPYLEDLDFGFEAACVLKALWETGEGEPKEQRPGGGIDFSEVAARRAEKQAGRRLPAAPEAEAIFAAVESLLSGDADVQAQARAIGLASIGLTLPYGDKTVLIERFLALPLPVRNKQRLLTGLILAGESVAADIVIEAIRAFLEEAQEKPWMLHRDNRWELEGWLGLLPCTDRPETTVTGVEMVFGADRHPQRMEEVVRSLSVAPGEAAERTLGELARRFPALAGEYEWIKAFTRRRTITAIGMLLDQLAEPSWPDRRGGTHVWSLGRDIAALTADLPELEEELLRRFGVATGTARQVIEQALAKLGGPACVLALARDHAAHNRTFDRLLDEAIRETALAREPAAAWAGAFELHPIAVTALRRELFAMVSGTPAEAAVAGACLTAIDALRDEYGPTGLEPRHPDITTGRPWPVMT